jgi:hypothetical protein
MKVVWSTSAAVQILAGLALSFSLLLGADIIIGFSLMLGDWAYVLSGRDDSSNMGLLFFAMLTIFEVIVWFSLIRVISNKVKKKWWYLGATFFWGFLAVFIACMMYGLIFGVLTSTGFIFT